MLQNVSGAGLMTSGGVSRISRHRQRYSVRPTSLRILCNPIIFPRCETGINVATGPCVWEKLDARSNCRTSGYGLLHQLGCMNCIAVLRIASLHQESDSKSRKQTICSTPSKYSKGYSLRHLKKGRLVPRHGISKSSNSRMIR